MPELALPTAAKQDEILNILNAGMGSIKSVQRGTATIAASSTNVSVTISPVNMSKSFLEFSYHFNQNAAHYIPSGKIKNSTSLAFTTGNPSSGNTITIEWQVIEFY